MFERISVDGFRGLDQVDVGPFGRINIIVGPGGTGKTSLLEALWTLAGDGRADVLTIALQQRGIELVGSPAEIRRLYEGYWSGGLAHREISLRGRRISTDRICTIRAVEPTVFQSTEIDPLTGGARTGVLRPIITYQLTWSDPIGPSTARVHVTAQGPQFEPGAGVRIPQRLHGARTGYSRHLARIWSQVEDRGEAEPLLALLRDIDPEVTGVRIGSSDTGVAVLRVAHERLGKVADPEMIGGWLRATIGHLAALSDVAGGILLIDEFDGPLHVSVLPKVARYLAEAARRLNVQVFLTTHREESVDAFLDLPEHLDDVVVLRAKRQDGRISFESVPGKEALFLRDEVGIDFRRTG